MARSDLAEVPLGSLCEGIYDGPHATPKAISSGPIFLGITSLDNGRLDLKDPRYLSEVDFLRWTKRVTPQQGDIVFSYETKIGEAAIIPSGLRCCLGRRMGLLRINTEVADPRFVLYTYLGPEFQSIIRARTVSGSTVERILLTELPDYPMRIPSLIEQQAIAHILGTLDDKIELYHRMNETLEAVARAVFKSWFVDFNPVRAKADGRQPVGMDAETVVLFPGSFEDSALGKIPKGWKPGNLGEIAQNPRASVRAEDLPVDSRYIGLEHMPRKSIALSEWGNSDEVRSNKYAFSKDDFLFGKLRPYFHKVGVATVDGICSTDILVVQPLEHEYYGIVLMIISSHDFVAHTDSLSTGTKMPRTKWSDMSKYQVIIPPSKVAKAFSKLTRPFVRLIQENIAVARTLADIRDTLLPELISGEIRLKDAEKFVEEHVG